MLPEKFYMIPLNMGQEFKHVSENYKTVAAKKTAMGNIIKQQIYIICALDKQFKTGAKVAWHLGVQYNKNDLQRAVNNLNKSLQFKSNL